MGAYAFQVGSFKCMSFNGGERLIDIRKIFAHVPDDEMQAAIEASDTAPDAHRFGLNILYIDSGRQRVLIDAGIPPGAVPDAPNLRENLRAEGIDAESISHIILTHGHWDHFGGIADLDGNLLYPNARYVMWKMEWENWTLPEKLAEKDEHNANHAGRILPLIADRIDLLETEGEFLPGLSAIHAPGHTAGQIAIMVESDGATLLHAADSMHLPIQIAYPTWTPGIDADHATSRATRHAILQRAGDENMLLMATHFPHPALGKVTQTENNFQWQPI